MKFDAAFVKKEYSLFGKVVTWTPIRNRLKFSDGSLVLVGNCEISLETDRGSTTYACEFSDDWTLAGGLVASDLWEIDLGKKCRDNIIELRIGSKTHQLDSLGDGIKLDGLSIGFSKKWFDYSAVVDLYDTQLVDAAKIISAKSLFIRWKFYTNSTSL